jgi:hypothetical protein
VATGVGTGVGRSVDTGVGVGLGRADRLGRGEGEAPGALGEAPTLAGRPGMFTGPGSGAIGLAGEQATAVVKASAKPTLQ